MNNLSNIFSVCGISKSKLVSSHVFIIQNYINTAFGECVFSAFALLHNSVFMLPTSGKGPTKFLLSSGQRFHQDELRSQFQQALQDISLSTDAMEGANLLIWASGSDVGIWIGWTVGITASAKSRTLLSSHFPNQLAKEKQDYPEKEKKHSSRHSISAVNIPCLFHWLFLVNTIIESWNTLGWKIP